MPATIVSKLVKSVRKRARRLLGGPQPPETFLSRENIARIFLRGDGIEIGALNHPLRVSRAARVRYVDRLSLADLRRQFPELREERVVEPDILDDGETLATVPDASQDFVIANHFVEHCEDPLGALGAMLRVLKEGGVLFLAVPDKRYTFDKDRPVTPIEHLLRDHREGPEVSRRAHYEEWARLVVGTPDDAGTRREADRLMGIRYAIHFHVWTQIEMLELLLALRRAWSFDVELASRRKNEVIFILRKAGGRERPAGQAAPS